MNQALHVSSRSGIVHQDGTLVPIGAGDCRDRRVVCVFRQRIFELDHCVAVAEERCWCKTARVEDDGGDVRWHVCVGVGGSVVHVCGDGGGGMAYSGIVDVVEEDARDGDVGLGVALPSSVGIDIRDDGRVSAVRKICVNVSERLDIRVTVELRDTGDVVLVCGITGCAGAAVHVDNDLPLHLWVSGDGGGGVFPG